MSDSMIAAKEQIIVQRAGREHLDAVRAVTNEAFLADAFFKKEAYHQRFTREDVDNLYSSTNANFLVAVDTTANEVCGSIFFRWDEESDGIESESPRRRKVVGHFSAVSVPERFARRGIGKLLVKAAELLLLRAASEGSNEQEAVDVRMEMGVINLRKDLFPWYESQGYCITKEALPHDEELARIVLDDMEVYCVLMAKQLISP
jgi:GNAT superfamily N-acetyltransferase